MRYKMKRETKKTFYVFKIGMHVIVETYFVLLALMCFVPQKNTGTQSTLRPDPDGYRDHQDTKATT